MDKNLPVISLLSLAVSAILGGCGGGGDSTPTPEAKILSVKAIDGYLKGAEVWLDINGNNALDSDEPYALSMEGGVAKLDVTNVTNPAAYRVLVKAIAGKTVDETTGPVTKSFAMSAPAGVTVVTPLSTLVDQTIQQNPTLTQAQAVAQVAEDLKLPADKLLGDFLQEADASLKKTLQVYAINVAAEVLPSDLADADIKQVLDDSQAVGEALDDYLQTNPLDDETSPDDIRVTKPNEQGVIVVIKDSDGDDVADAADAFPQDAKEWLDSDGDKVGDNSDAFPQNPKEWKDSDGDKVGDNSDAFPQDASESKDSDGDKVGDNSDAFPTDPKEWRDSDGDKVGDNSDAFPQDASESKDSDGDKVGDNSDAFPQDASESKDSDGDKVGDNSDALPNDASETKDSDGDKVGDNSDAFPLDAKEWKDSDGDKVGDNSDAFPQDASESKDSDGDKVGDNSDAFPLDAKEWKDSDGDKVGDNSDAFPQDASESKDSDGDKVGDNSDAFPLDAKEWKDSDGDKVGDNSDAFPQDASESKDSDGDKVGDNSDAFPLDASESKDSDGDKVGDNSDAFPNDANRAQADVVSTEEKTYTYMEDHTKVSLDLKLVAKKTVSKYLDGRVVTQEEGTNYYWDKVNNDYLYLNGAKLIYNEYKNSNTQNLDGTFLRTGWWHKDVNQDGLFQFAGQMVAQGKKTTNGEAYWYFLDEDGALAETGISINPNNHYDGGDLAAAVAAKDYSKVDLAHYVTLTQSGSTEVRHFVQRSAPRNAPTDVVASDWLNIEAGTPVADYAETDTYTQLDDGGSLHQDENDWGADGTINQMHSIESHPDGTLITKSAGPIWANPQDGEFNEYADYNWQNSERTSYWYEWSKSSHTVAGKTVTTSEGQRYVLDPTPNANVKLVTAEQPNGLKFNEYVSTETQVSTTETTEFATWANYHLEGYPFTAAQTDIGQNYKVFLKETDGFWVGHRFAEWGTQNVTDLAAKVEALRQQGVTLDKIDASLLPGLSDYDGQLLNRSFRYQEDGQPRTWYWVTQLPAITGDNTWQTWKMVKLQLVDGGLTAAGYPNWLINDAGGNLFMLQPKSDNPWAWYNAYDVWNLGVWKQEGQSIDTLNGRFGTGLGLFFLNEQEATAALNDHTPTLADSDKDGVVDAEDAFPYDPTETVDSDHDGVGDNGDAFPNDPTETKDSDGDGVGDNAQAQLNGGSISAFLNNASEFFMAGEDGADELWTDHWQSLGSGMWGWNESNILIGKTQYKVDSSTGDISYRLTETGWTEMTEYEDLQMVGNSDGSVSITDMGHAGKLTGSCNDVGGKTLASVVASITASTQVVDSSATFSPGAQACSSSYTALASDGNYRIETWDYVGENAVQVNGQQATTLADLFSSSAPVASGPNAVATVFDKPIAAHSEQYGDVRLILVRSSANDTSGVAQLWQYNANVQGYQLLSNVTPENHQGWTLQTLHGVTLLTFSAAIQHYLEEDGSKAGFTEWQGRVQWVDNRSGGDETMLFMNKVAYDDLMKGRTLVTLADSDKDGVVDADDAFPYDPTETLDSDQDGVGDNGDAFPNDANETKDSDGDGVGDNAQALLKDGTVSAFLINASEFFMAGAGGADELWTDYRYSLNPNKFYLADSYILNTSNLYHPDQSVRSVYYALGANGWMMVTDSDEISLAGNPDGSVSVSEVADKSGHLAGSCQVLSGKPLSTALATITSNPLLVDSSANFSSGALGCQVTYSSAQARYTISPRDGNGNDVRSLGQGIATLDELFSSSAPVADGNGVASDFEKPIAPWSDASDALRLVLVRSDVNATSGVAQLWQYNANVSGYQLLSDITPAAHQGWSLQTINGVKVLLLSDAIRNFLGEEDSVGYSELEGRVQIVEHEDAASEPLFVMNRVAYEDLLKGRQLDSDNDGVADDQSGSLTGDDAVAAFEALLTSQETFYSLYNEHGALGTTQVVGASTFIGSNYDYSSAQWTTESPMTGMLEPQGDGSVALSINNDAGVPEPVGSIRCNQVLMLEGSLIQTLLTQVTGPDELALMQAKVGNATFSAGAKAYINTHTDAEGDSTEVVLNPEAYQDLLTLLQ